LAIKPEQTMNREELWKEEIQLLQTIIEKSGLLPVTKWGMKVYTHKQKNVVGAIGFKNHFCLWFYNGVFLSDPFRVLSNAQEGKTKALRQWRMESKSEIDENKILIYIQEAIQNEEEGKVWKPEKSSELTLPEILDEKLNQDEKLMQAFESLTPFKKREFVEYLLAAKREATLLARIEKITPMILQGVGLNDKYR
jgi:uncharacterized protein YdeI (YjbR/CyaY-like superfamily)